MLTYEQIRAIAAGEAPEVEEPLAAPVAPPSIPPDQPEIPDPYAAIRMIASPNARLNRVEKPPAPELEEPDGGNPILRLLQGFGSSIIDIPTGVASMGESLIPALADAGFSPILGPMSDTEKAQLKHIEWTTRRAMKKAKQIAGVDVSPEELGTLKSDPFGYLAYHLGSGLGQVGTALAAGAVGGPALAIGLLSTREFDGMKTNLVELGLEEGEAEVYATGYTAVATLLEYAGIDNLMKLLGGKELTGSFLAKVGKAAAQQFAVEGLEESSQESAAIITEALAGVYESGGKVDTVARIAESGLIGGLVGMVTGGGAGFRRSMQDRRVAAVVEATITADETNSVEAFRNAIMQVEDVTPELANHITNRVVGKVADMHGQTLAEYLNENLGKITVEMPGGQMQEYEISAQPEVEKVAIDEAGKYEISVDPGLESEKSGETTPTETPVPEIDEVKPELPDTDAEFTPAEIQAMKEATAKAEEVVLTPEQISEKLEDPNFEPTQEQLLEVGRWAEEERQKKQQEEIDRQIDAGKLDEVLKPKAAEEPGAERQRQAEERGGFAYLKGDERYEQYKRGRFEEQGFEEEPPPTFFTGVHTEGSEKLAKEHPGMGLLIQPNTASLIDKAGPYSIVALDNAAFGGTFNETKWRRMMDRAEAIKDKVAFVVAPDVVEDADATNELFAQYAPEIRERGFPVAYVLQDGIEENPESIPWDEIDVLFVGGSTDFKVFEGKYAENPSREALDYIYVEARTRGIPIHYGRVNSQKRFSRSSEYGGSADGTILRFGPKNIERIRKWLSPYQKEKVEEEPKPKKTTKATVQEGQKVTYRGKETSVKKVYEPGEEDTTIWVDLESGETVDASTLNQDEAEDRLDEASDRLEYEVDELTQKLGFKVVKGEGRKESSSVLTDDELVERMKTNRSHLEEGDPMKMDMASGEFKPQTPFGQPAVQQFREDYAEVSGRLRDRQAERTRWRERRDEIREELDAHRKELRKRLGSGFKEAALVTHEKGRGIAAEMLQLDKNISESRKAAMHLVLQAANVLGIKDLGTPERPIGFGPETLMQEEDNPLAGKVVKTAFRLKDGSILEATDERPLIMHFVLAQQHGLLDDEDAIVGSGFTIDGVYSERPGVRDSFASEGRQEGPQELTHREDIAAHAARPPAEYDAAEEAFESPEEKRAREPYEEVEDLYQQPAPKEAEPEAGDFKRSTPKRFMAARKGTKYVDMLTPLTTKDILANGLNTYLSSDGTVGFTVSQDGDIGNVFNNKGPYGLGAVGVAEAVRLGGKTLDAFDMSSEGAQSGSKYQSLRARFPDGLPGYYRQFGFEVYNPSWFSEVEAEDRLGTGRLRFDPSQAPPKFDEALFGQPDVVFMRLKKQRRVRGLEREVSSEAMEMPEGFAGSMPAAAAWFDAEYRRLISKSGLKTPEDRRARAYLMSVAEVFKQLQLDESGTDWYQRFHDAVVELADKHIPGIRSSHGMRMVYGIVNGILSNGNSVPEQTRKSLHAMVSYDGTEFSERNVITGEKYSRRGHINEAQIRRLNQFLADPHVDHDLEKFHDLMKEEKTAREWISWMKESPTVTSTSISEVLMDDVIPGYRIFGPKVGRYTGNILGDTKQVTADVWMIRWWSRILGKAYDKETDTPREALKVAEMREMRQTVVDLANTFRVEASEMQAAIWTMEKMLWEHASGKKKGTVSPDEFAAIIDKEVSDNGEFQTLAATAAQRLQSQSDRGRGGEVGQEDGRGRPDAQPLEAGERAREGQAEETEELEQSAYEPAAWKGKITFKKGRKAEITFKKNADVSTVLHEISHLALRTLPQEIKDIIIEDLGGTPGRPMTRALEEKFARMSEAMLLSGEPPSQRVAEEWTQLHDRMREIYGDAVTGLRPEDIPATTRLLFEGLHSFAGTKTAKTAAPTAPMAAREKKAPKSKEPTEDDSFEDKKLEAAFNKARLGKQSMPTWRSIALAAKGFFRRFARQYENIPETSRKVGKEKLPSPALFLEALRRIENSVEGIAEFKVRRPLMNAVDHLSKKQRRVLDRLLFLRHLKTIADNFEQDETPYALPFGWTKAEVLSELAKLESLAAKDVDVQQAAKDLAELWNNVRDEVREAFSVLGMPTDFLDSQHDNYLHHEILKLEEGYGANERLRVPVRSWMKRLSGRRDEAINLNYEQAQGAVLTQLLVDAEIARQLKTIKDRYDLRPKLLKAAARTQTELEELIPDGYTAWTPRGSKIFFKVMALSDKAAQEILENEIAEITGEDLRAITAVADAAGWIIPAPFVEALESKAADASRMSQASRKVMRFWKAWQLTSPRRIFKYVTRNFIGDLSKALTWNPGTAKKMVESMKQLQQVVFSGKAPGPELEQWLIRNGYSSGMMQQEYTPSDKERLRGFFEDITWENFARKPTLRRWMALSRKHVAFMESVSRFASFLSYLEQMKASKDGKTPKNWGASDQGFIESFDDVYDRAYWLSNQLLGSYDQISQTGRALRRHAFPFWSFQELNAKSHYRLLKNALESDDVARKLGQATLGATFKATALGTLFAGRWLARAMILEALVFAWNHTVFPDEEEDLPEDVRKTAHFIFGRDPQGNVLYFNRFAVFQEVREWFGAASYPQITYEWASGKITKQEAARMIAEDFAEQGPLNKIVQGSLGPWKTVAEAMVGMTTFPSAIHPRQIGPPLFAGRPLEPAKLEFLARSIGLENELKVAIGRPSKAGGDTRIEQYLRTLPEFFLYRAEPGWSQYQDTLSSKRRWEEFSGKDETYGTGQWSSKSDALRQFKRALAYEQKGIAAVHLNRYMKMGGTARGAMQSFRRMDPLYGLDDDELRSFAEFMGPRGRQQLLMAVKYYEEEMRPSDELEQWLTEVLP